MTETPSKYIGTYVDFTQTDSDDPKKYSWQQLEGSQGPQGKQGISGTNGADGKTSYLHIKYSNDGGKTFTGNSGEDIGAYIGTCVDYAKDDPTSVGTYKWAKIKGEAGAKGDKGDTGKGVKSTSVAYQVQLPEQQFQLAHGLGLCHLHPRGSICGHVQSSLTLTTQHPRYIVSAVWEPMVQMAPMERVLDQ